MANYLLDASVLIDWLRAARSGDDTLRGIAVQHTLVVCSISVAETYAGVRDEDRHLAERLFAGMDYWDIPPSVARLAGDLRFRYARQGVQLSTPDVLQAALAISREAFFLTANLKDFPMPELKLQPFPLTDR